MLRIGLVLIGLLVRCGDPSPHPPSTETPSGPAMPSAPESESLTLLQLSLLGLPSANAYSVRLYWPSAPARAHRWKLERLTPEGVLETVGTFPASVREHFDDKVRSASQYTYYLSLLSETGESIVIDVEGIAIPEDLAIARPTAARDLKNVQRLFIEPGGVIQLHEQHSEIRVKELISRQGIIEAFRSGAKAAPGQSGRNAGSLFLSAEKAIGELTILGNGESGGDGINGINGSPGSDGKKGDDGEIQFTMAAIIAHLPPFKDLNKTVEEFAKNHRPCDPEWRFFYQCAKDPQDGEAGAPGSAGSMGGNGGNGGNSLKAVIEFKEAESLKLSFEHLPGKAGTPGIGGEGGKGGTGGAPGKQDRHCICQRIASSGAKGFQGEHGSSGAPGQSGTVMPFCIKLGDRRIGDCS